MRIYDSSNFSQDWLFHSGDTPWWQPTGEKFDAELTRWHTVHLPHCFNAEDTFTPARGFYRGIVWYRKLFSVTENMLEKQLFVEFGAAFSLADVWVNEQYVGQFMGGYTGFSIDATSMLQEGENLIAVKLDSSHHSDILPGIDAMEMDYALYGGLYREVAFVVKEKLHIAQHGIKVTTPEVSEDNASIEVTVEVVNENDTPQNVICEATLRDPDENMVTVLKGEISLAAKGRDTLLLTETTVPAPALWSVDSPNLYNLEVTLQQNGDVIDSDATSVGFRWFEFTVGKGFFLNGEPVKLRGLNRHQDYPGLGNALPPRLQRKDAAFMKEMGVNFVRLSHYPQHPVFLDACDQLGIIVYEEIASWQFIGGEMFARNAEVMMREMIKRDKNHPSIILWGLLNEGRSRCLFERLHRVAKECDPTRLTIYADNHPLEGKKLGSAYVSDVLGINYKLPHLDEIHAALPEAKMLSTETTNYEHRRRGDIDHDIAQVRKFKVDTDIVEAREYMAGMALWSLHDYGTDYELSWPVQDSGIVDGYRLPKGGYWYLKARWSGEPVARIIGYWNFTKGETRPVLVCSNGESVALFLNGKSLGVKKDGYLCEWEVPYEAGELKAVAQCGDAVVEHALHTAVEPHSLQVSSSESTLIADGADVAEITVTVLDAAGHPLLAEEGYAAFRVEGPAVLRGTGGIPCTPVLAGIGRIIVQATTMPGEIQVLASYRGLPEVMVTLISVI